MSSSMQDKFQQFDEEMKEREEMPGLRPVPLWKRLVAGAALGLSGYLLYRLPGSFPPPVWVELLMLLRTHALLPLEPNLVLLGRSGALLLACLLWLFAAWRVLRLWRRPDGRLVLATSPQPASRAESPEPDRERIAPALADSTGQHEDAGQRAACLYALVSDCSLPARTRPALPALFVGPGDIGLVAPSEVIEGLGLAVASCCHAGSGRRAAASGDAALLASGLRWWPDATPPVLPIGLFLVADGLTVWEKGRSSSSSDLAVQVLAQALLPLLTDQRPLERDDLERGLLDGVQQANVALCPGDGRPWGSDGVEGTALTAALVIGTTAYIANVGNSRAYLYHEGDGLLQVTFDHAALESDEDAPAVEGIRAAQPAQGGQLYRSLGSASQVEADLFAVQLEFGDILLLCTNGLWELVDRSVLEQTLQWFAGAPVADPARLCSILRERAQERGATDHLSLIVAQVVRLARSQEAGVLAEAGTTAHLSNAEA